MSICLRLAAARAGDTPYSFVYFARIFCIFLAFGNCINGKVFDRCELAQLLHSKHHLDLHEVATWTCIAQHASGFNTEAYAGGPDGASHGLFHISDVYWCSPPGKGLACNLPCERLRDADLTDDLDCLHIIYGEHKRLSGDGYNAWNAYQQFCRRGVEDYVQDCFSNQRILPVAQQSSVDALFASGPAPFYTPTALAVHLNSISGSYSEHKSGKVYDRCELAQELYNKHKMPMEQIPTWVCIAQHESRFDTSAVGRLNADGSADHGLFQISDLYWCSHDRYSGGKACDLQCTKLLDNDITDDVRCIKRIHGEHERLSGDGFTAWSVYDRDCRNQQYAFISSCFREQASQKPAKSHVNTPPGSFPLQTPNAHLHQQYTANPFLKHNVAPTKSTNTLQQHQYTPQNTYTQTHYTHNTHNTHNTQPHKGKVYKRCELAQELYFKHKFPMQDIATWLCIVQHESNYDTSAVGRLNADGSADHGLFQISDLYWCSHDSFGGKACNISCAKLLDSDISDDVKCIRTIHDEHTRISGDGFMAWTVYKGNCRNQRVEQVFACFDSNEISKTQKFLTTTQVGGKNNNNKSATITTGLALAKGKIYAECELAQELYYKHRLPLMDIPTWVCIAKHESSFNTAAVGRLNADGSTNHGLFQISDLYWCSHEQFGGKACNIPCHKLLNWDISDDIECIKIIHAEHTRISGDGFTAWVGYNKHCRKQNLDSVASCFPTDEIRKTQLAHPTIETNRVGNGAAMGKGKIYKKCELAQELYFKHKMPMEDVPTWVCIAEHESSFNTAAVGRLNVDGSADHGLFQISDLYWCSHDGDGGKACQISCNKLLDNDITDDVRCVKTIYDEHTHLSGDGFTAWTVYNRNCRNQQLNQIGACFNSNELQKAQQTSRIGQSEKTDHVTKTFSINQITNLPKKIKHKNELNHPFVYNPFLNQYRAVKFVNTTLTPKIITVKPASHYVANEVVPLKTSYINNPFLNKLVQSHQPGSATTSRPKSVTNNPATLVPTFASYASNPFLSKYQQHYTKMQIPPPSPPKPQKLNYNSNPFLTKYIGQSPSLALIESNKRQPSSSVPLEKQTVAEYLNNPFLQKFSAPSHSMSIKSSKQPQQYKTHTTPSSTEKTKMHLSPTRSYVNSDAFRTMPQQAQVSTAYITPGRATKTPNTAAKTITQNLHSQYYSSVLTTTTKKPTTFVTAVRKPSVDTHNKNQPTTLTGTTTTKRPSTTTTWNWQHQLQVLPTKAAFTQITTGTTKAGTTARNRNNLSTTKAPPTASRTTTLAKTQKSGTAISNTLKTALMSTTRKSSTMKNLGDLQRKQTTTVKPKIEQSATKTASRMVSYTTKAVSTSTKRPSTITTRRSSTTVRSPITEKIGVVARTTTRSTTTAEKSTKHTTTTTRRPNTTAREPITQKTYFATKTTTHPTTTTQKTTKRTTTTTKMQLQHYSAITTRKPITTVRTPITHKTFATRKATATATAKSTHRSNSFTTTKVPYTTKNDSSTHFFTQFKTKSHSHLVKSSAATKPTATTKRTTTNRPTTRKSAFYATSSADQKPNVSTIKFSNNTTTLKPKVTTKNPYRDDPFSHPFFAKYKEQFKVFDSTTTRKPASTTKYQLRTLVGEESEYYQQFRKHTAGNAKTVYAYAFGQNGTLAGHNG